LGCHLSSPLVVALSVIEHADPDERSLAHTALPQDPSRRGKPRDRGAAGPDRESLELLLVRTRRV
jgi:hypothetical protein